MIIGPHAVTSMLITTQFERFYIKSSYKNKSAWLAAVAMLSFLSHFLLDIVPHHDYIIDFADPANAYKLSSDILLAFVAFFIIFWSRVKNIVAPLRHPLGGQELRLSKENSFDLGFFLAIWLGILFACLPDVLTYISYQSNNLLLKNFKKFHDFFHSSKTLGAWVGYYIQIVICCGLIFWTRYLAKKNALEQLAILAGEEYELRFANPQ